MGSLRLESPVLYMAGKELGPIKDIQEIMPATDAMSMHHLGEIDFSQDRELSATFTPRVPCLNRKQFIRLIQKLGYSKKQAKKIAWETQKSKKMSYSYTGFLYTLGVLPHYRELV